MRTKIIFMFFFCAVIIHAQEKRNKNNYFSEKSEKEINTLEFSKYFKDRSINNLLDSLGRDYLYMNFVVNMESSVAVLLYQFDDNRDVIVEIILGGQSEYIDRSNETLYIDPNELVKEKIDKVSIILAKKERDQYEWNLEQNLKRKAYIESEIFTTQILQQYTYLNNKKIIEHPYYRLKNANILQHLKGLNIKMLFDIVGNNYYGYCPDIVSDSTFYFVDFWYKYKDDVDICITILLQKKLKLDDSVYENVLNSYSKEIYVYLLPPTKLSTLIKVGEQKK